jgi:hypothetical protein
MPCSAILWLVIALATPHMPGGQHGEVPHDRQTAT